MATLLLKKGFLVEVTFKKLKLYTKLGAETVHNYSQQNLFALICVLSSTYKSNFTAITSY